jgi:enoyl-CoA hydratase/carnithine racemase
MLQNTSSTAAEESWPGQLEKEREFLSWCADHPNGREGISAFLEKRRPVYNSRERRA